MSSSSSQTATAQREWSPGLDLTPKGLSQFDPARVQQAIEDGYRAGHDAGRAEAMTTGRAQIEAELTRVRAEATELFAGLRAATDQAARAESVLSQRFAERVVDAAIQIAEAIIGHQLADETVAATEAVQRALTGLDRSQEARVRLNPHDLELLDGVSIPANVILEADPAIRPGEAIGQTDDRTVDARISTALQRAKAALGGTT